VTSGAVALGGMLGAGARHAVALGIPGTGGLPWATFAVNVSGCLLMGVVMALVVEVPGIHPLVRPFVGVGLLGGFTTFSAYSAEVLALHQAGEHLLGGAYLLGTAAGAIGAVCLGAAMTRRYLSHRVDVRHRGEP
jgi:CrcB protein